MRGRRAAREAKIPADVEFRPSRALGSALVARAAAWKIRRAPPLGDQAYGNDAKLRTRLHADGIDYVLSVGPECDVYAPDTVCAVPPQRPGSRGPAPSVPRADREPTAITELVAGLDADAFQTVAFRDADGQRLVSRFAFARVVAAHAVTDDHRPPRWQWLIIEWPEGHDEPTDYWLSNLPEDTEPSASRGSPACAGRSNSTTASSRANSASTTTRAAATWTSTTTARS